MFLDSNFGATLDEIKKDGFEITEEIKIDLSVEIMQSIWRNK